MLLDVSLSSAGMSRTMKSGMGPVDKSRHAYTTSTAVKCHEIASLLGKSFVPFNNRIQYKNRMSLNC